VELSLDHAPEARLTSPLWSYLPALTAQGFERLGMVEVLPEGDHRVAAGGGGYSETRNLRRLCAPKRANCAFMG